MSQHLPHRNPLPQLIPARVRHVRANVEAQVWQRQQPLNVSCSSEQFVPIDCAQAASLELRPLTPGDHFGRGGDQWSWFWLRIDVPAANTDEVGLRYLRWQCQGETTVWIDGIPWAGLDIGHRACPLPDRACTLWLECCSWQTGVWITMADAEAIGPHGMRFDGAQLAVRNQIAWDCTCDIDAILQTMEQALREETDLKLAERVGYCRALESASPRLRKLLAELEVVCDIWQVSHDLSSLRAACQDFFRRWPAETWQPVAAVCGHAHIDLVWLWPEAATRKKLVHSFATVMRLLERYPELVFTQSMPTAYRMLEQDSPELMSQVKSYIASGRWEVLGAFEVEPDTNLPGGEALARSIALGQKKIKELTGQYSEIAWIPDVFGYNQCLPQIMALGGVKFFYTTKMTWSNITKFPYTSFIWRGADGTEVLAHLGTTNYSGEVLLHVHDEAMAEHRQVAEHDELLLPTGYGDGGGGPTELHVELVRRFENLSGAPKTRWTRADQFFSRMDKMRHKMPIYHGELYLEYHRGTYTTQSEFKRLYRRAEQGLQMHEAVRVSQGQGPLADEAWLRVAFAHFHDAIPGSSIREVYAEMNPELAAIGDREYASALDELTRNRPGDEPAAFNALPYQRTTIVQLEDELFQVELPAIGSAPLKPDSEVADPVLQATPQVLSHSRLEARFNRHGQLTELTIDGKPLLLDGSPSFLLCIDDPAAFDAWDIDHPAVRLGSPVGGELQLKVVEHSLARAVLESQPVSIGQASELQVRYILEAGCTHLKLEAVVNWQESHQLLKYVVPTHYRGHNARFGCPFGAIERPQLAGTEATEAMWEVPASRWAAVQFDGGTDGLAILAESKLGYAARDGVLSLSLLRSTKWPDASADMGSHTIPFAMGRLQLQTTDAHLSTSMSADALFSPVLTYIGMPCPPRFHWHELGSLNASWCAPSATERSAYYLRLHETAGQHGTARLRLNDVAKKAEIINLLEQSLDTASIDGQGMIAIAYRPWQILTLRIAMQDQKS